MTYYCIICGIRASFNFKGETKRLYCSKHAVKSENGKKGMINLEKKCCEIDDCESPAKYNLFGEKIKLYCKNHANQINPDMIDITSKKCESKGCPIVPVFNYGNETVGRFCKDHALKNMIDVKNSHCKDCTGKKIRASYNYPNIKKAEYCEKHAKKI